jgi:LysM repeat protein
MNVNLVDYFRKGPIRQNEYVVKPGDNLYKIAKQYGVTVDDLLQANDLMSTVIYPNQVLIISKSVPSGAMYFVEYVVKPDDTLQKISQTLNIPTEVIGKYNDVTKLVLAENQVLSIPARYNVYTIKENDSLETILSKTKMTLEEFTEANLKNLLVPGTNVYVK